MNRLAVSLLLGSLACPLVGMAADAPAAPPPASASAANPDTAAQVAAKLVSHRALYTLTLDHARGDVIAAGGTMAFDITDACDGWATRQRLKMTLTNRDGQPIEMVSDYATYESKDGTQLTFRMKQSTEQAVQDQVEGTATLNHPGGTGEIHYTAPKDSTAKLPEGTLFPMWHTATIIAGAEAGRKFFAVPLFDGTGSDGAQDSSIAITSWGQDGKAPFPLLTGLPSGRVHVAFFKRGGDASQPEYEVGMRYWTNGVADDLTMDFGDFVMSGKLKELAPQPGHC